MAKAQPMTKAALVDHFSKKLGVTKKLANDFLVEYAQVSYKEAKKGFTFPGVGKLMVVSRKKRKGINPSTGERIIIPAKKVVKFKVSKTCQDAVYPPKK